MTRKQFDFLVIGLWLLIGVAIYLHYNRDKNLVPIPNKLIPVIPETNEGKTFEIRKITVLSGDSFDITLKNETRILAKLPLVAVDNAKEKVLDMLNHSTNPRVLLKLKQSDGHWLVDLFFIENGKEHNLSEWLISNNLVYK